MATVLKVNKKIGITNIAFNPARYKIVYKQYKKGIYRELIAMMKDTKADSHVAGCLLGRDAGYQKEYTIKPFSEDKKDVERAEWARTVLEALNVRKLFKGIMGGKKYRFSVIDFDWDVKNGRQTPIAFNIYDHKYFRFDPDANYDVLKVDWGTRLEDIPPETMVCDYDEDQPLMLPVLRDYILKEFGLESWASFLENFGEPILIGKYPAGCDPKIKKELEEGIAAIAAASRGTMPIGTEIELKEASKNTGDHKDFKHEADKGISISLLGHENAVTQTKAQFGENLGPYKVKREQSIDDLYWIDANMQWLLNLLYDRNFGDGRYARFITDKSAPLDIDKHAKVLDTAYSHGVKIPINEYRKMGIEVYDDQEFVQKAPNPFDSM